MLTGNLLNLLNIIDRRKDTISVEFLRLFWSKTKNSYFLRSGITPRTRSFVFIIFFLECLCQSKTLQSQQRLVQSLGVGMQQVLFLILPAAFRPCNCTKFFLYVIAHYPKAFGVISVEPLAPTGNIPCWLGFLEDKTCRKYLSRC